MDKENQRLDAEKRIKGYKEKNASLLHDKKFYLQKIVDQREELKEAKIALAKKDQRITELENLLAKNQQESKTKQLSLIRQIAYEPNPAVESEAQFPSEDVPEEEDNDELKFMTEPPALDTSGTFPGQEETSRASETMPRLDAASSKMGRVLEERSIRKSGSGAFFCPYTQNKKFERFIGDLLDLNLPHSKTQEEIVRFVSLVESFYCDKITQLIRKERQSEKSLKR